MNENEEMLDENPNDEDLVVKEESVDNTLEVTDSENQVEAQETSTQEEAQPEYKYTQEDVDKILEGRTNSLNRKHQKEKDKYEEMKSILEQGLGVTGIDNINKQLLDFYKDQGVDIKQSSSRNARDEEILASADVNEILTYGDQEVLETAKELANKQNRTVREEAVLKRINAEHRFKTSDCGLRESRSRQRDL